MLKIENLNAFYGKSHIIWNLDLIAKKGEITALVGRNGMGKTTTLKCVMGLIKEKTGSISLLNERIENKQPYEIARLGVSFVPDNMGIFPTLTVEENILISAYLSKRKGLWNLEEIYLLFPKLKILRNSNGGHLSGGEKKMLAIGRALAANPSLIIIDEPTEGLAPIIVQTLRSALNEIKKAGITVLLADQNLNFVKQTVDFVYVIEEGRIRYSGSINDVLKNPEIVEKYLTV